MRQEERDAKETPKGNIPKGNADGVIREEMQKGRNLKEMILNENNGADCKGGDSKCKDPEGKDFKRKDARCGSLEPVEETNEIVRGNYSSHAEREKRWVPSNCRNEYEYSQYWIRGDEWIYRDGLRREARAPTREEIRNIDGGTEALGFGEFSECAYDEVLAQKPSMWSFPCMKGGRPPPRYEEIHRAGHAEKCRDRRRFRHQRCGAKEGRG